MKRTNIYVDGFNLYYGSLKGSPYKWLNLLEFCQRLLPKNNIHKIKFFSALVSARPHDPDQPVRQQAYWRALKTISNLSIIGGSFLSHPVQMPAIPSKWNRGGKPVWVMKTEEKGSDVNLATHLIHDAHNKDFDIAFMITNDSDLLEPMRIVREELGLPVGIINPQQKPSFQLAKHASFVKSVRPWILKSSQFPTILTDREGTFSKPKTW
jgi:uncharacterized LabA/DUF88 family protein